MSLKHQAFTKSFGDLVSSVTDSVKSLSDACYSNELISSNTRDKILDLNETNGDKARRLLGNVGLNIERDPATFETFLMVLNESYCQDESEKLLSTFIKLEKQAEIDAIERKKLLNKIVVPKPPRNADAKELLSTPHAFGEQVVDQCIETLKQWIKEENKFMKRIAFVMTEFGEQTSTRGSSGGIWQVSPIAFQDTKNNGAHWSLPRKYKRLMDLYQIDWMRVTYADLDKPLYSALAARLYLSNNPAPIPPCHDISEQAAYWKYHYMKGDGGKLSVYTDKVLMLEK